MTAMTIINSTNVNPSSSFLVTFVFLHNHIRMPIRLVSDSISCADIEGVIKWRRSLACGLEDPL